MDKKPFLKHGEEVKETADSGIVLYGLGDFGRANLKVLQENCEAVEAGQKIKVVTSRSKDEVVRELYKIAQKRLYNPNFTKEDVFWWCSNLKEISDVGNADFSEFKTKFEIITEEKVFIDEEIEGLQEEVWRKINSTIHVLTCSSKQAPYYKEFINKNAKKRTIIVDGVKGHTEKVDLDNPNVEYVSLVGPNYAIEIIEKAFTAILLASESEKTANQIKNLYNVSPYIKAEIFDKPEKLERVGIYKNIATFAFGIAINYITDKKKRTDLFVKILEDFTKYAQYVGLEDGDVEKNIEEMTYAFLGDMWMCMLHGISHLTGGRSRNLTVAREVGESLKEKEAFQQKVSQTWRKKFYKKNGIKKEQTEFFTEDLFDTKVQINDLEKFVNPIAKKNGLRTIEGAQSFFRLKKEIDNLPEDERVNLEIVDFIYDVLRGEDIPSHPYLQLEERDGRADMSDEKFVAIKNKTRKFKETTMERNCPANTLALVLSEYTKDTILKIKNPETKKHVFRMILDVFQEEKGNIKKVSEWIQTKIKSLIDYSGEEKLNPLDAFIANSMSQKN